MEPIPFLSLTPQYDRVREELEKSFKKVIGGQHFVLGEEVAAFEKEFAIYSGVRHCITVANGLDALYISLKVLGVGQGDEVIVPAFTCAPTWMAVSRTGAAIVAVEVDEKSFNMDVTKIGQAVTSKTKAILPVNLFGRPAALFKMLAVAKEKNIFVVEDNAQGQGANVGGKKTGSFGFINATSFYPTKNLGALGDGGAITTDDNVLAEKARQLRNYGSSIRFHHDAIGINSRLDELQAAFLRIKLTYLDEWNQQRRELALRLQKLLEGVGDLRLPRDEKGEYSVYHLFVVSTSRRDQLRKFLRLQNVETDIHYPIPPHLQKAYGHLGFKTGSFPITENICETILSLPLWPGMTGQQVDYVGECVKKFFR